MSKKKLIRSSTMKCFVNKDVKQTGYNTKSLGSILYKRKEKEGNLELLDDFSMNKITPKNESFEGGFRFETPLVARRDLTYLCNFSCIHCYSNCGSGQGDYLSFEENKKVLDILDENKVHFVQILGGEPLIYPQILELVEYALTKKFIFCINSNGYLLNKEKIQKLADLGLQHIQISLHGLEGSHEKVTRMKQSFEKASENIRLLVDAGMSVSVSCVVSDFNQESIFEFLAFLSKLGIRNIQLLTPLDEGRAKKTKFSLHPDAHKRLERELIKFKNINPHINLDLPGFDVDVIDGLINENRNSNDYEFMFGCMGGVSGIRINPSGDIAVCVGSAGESMGNILKEDLPDIMKKLYQWRIDNVSDMCKDCDSYLQDCQGACYLRF